MLPITYLTFCVVEVMFLLYTLDHIFMVIHDVCLSESISKFITLIKCALYDYNVDNKTLYVIV